MMTSIETSRLAIGTAQLGMDYGVASLAGQMSVEGARRMLIYAQNQGIDTLDTAISYGSSEKRLGEIGLDGWNVVTKLPGVPATIRPEGVRGWVQTTITQSLERLNVDKLFSLLLHKPSDLFEIHGQALLDHLLTLKAQGQIEKIGISVYSPSELENLIDRFPLDLVQLPLNIFDQRFADSGWLTALERKGVEIHSRSAFLQGLLLMPAHARPSQFQKWQDLWTKWDNWLKEIGMTPVEACLSTTFSQAEINRVVVGFDSPDQLRQICNTSLDLSIKVPTQLQSAPEDLINPSRWAKL
jgi:aryl-alcohol dehydrogenase-like predicted oxidoreductase